MPVPIPSAAEKSHSLSGSVFDREFWEGDTSWMVLADVAKIILIYLILRFALYRLIDKVLMPALAHGEKRIDAAQASRIKTLAGLVKSSLIYILNFVFGIMLLRALRLDPIPLLTTASVAGLAVGFGAQKLVKDMISGFFILLENQYGIGDYVTIGAVTGTVEEVGLRTTRIRDDSGKLYILSNGDISQVCNQSRGKWLRLLRSAWRWRRTWPMSRRSSIGPGKSWPVSSLVLVLRRLRQWKASARWMRPG